ncbi:hypothetical protein OQA88_6227 [Cercophora sp. LCS_1]
MSPISLRAPGPVPDPVMATDATKPANIFVPEVYQNYYDADDNMAPHPKRARPTTADEMAPPPELPRKSALRASRLLDNLGLTLGGSIETVVTPGQATPLDLYMSSEEASSDADDFSDYDYDSSVDDESNTDPMSPSSRRSSHEDTARVVSVIYSGKPSIVDLTLLRRRSVSPNSSEMTSRTRSSTVSSLARSPVERSETPASSVASVSPVKKGGNLLSELLVKKRPPPFLSIDPYANGSTYSLEMPKHQHSERPKTAGDGDESVKVPKTPTQILRGVSRTFSLVRKRSRPLLRADSPQQQPRQSSSTYTFSVGGDEPPAADAPEKSEVEEAGPSTPQTPVTYGDILKAAKKNAMMMPPSPMAHTPISPVSPQITTGQKRGILSGLAARRRSIKLTGKVVG